MGEEKSMQERRDSLNKIKSTHIKIPAYNDVLIAG